MVINMNIKNFLKFLGIFFLYFINDLIYLIPIILLKIDFNSLNQTIQMLLMVVSDLIISVILFLIYKKYLIEKFKDFKNNFNQYLEIGLKGWLIGLGIMWLGNFLLAEFSPVKEALNENQVQLLIKTSPILAMMLTTIFAPINEEIIFRKSIQDFIKNKWIYIIVSGLIFGYLHVSGGNNIYDFLYIIPYGALGSAFAYILSKTDNIYTTILMHMIHNGILTLISIFL